MKSAGKRLLEQLLVLERVVELRRGHRAGVEPRVEHRLDAARAGPLALRAVDGDVVDAGRCRSRSARSRPERSASSATEPTQVSVPQSSQRHTGSGVPQKRSRDSAQSTLFSSQSPKRPCLMCSGCQPIDSFSRSSLVLVRGGAREPGGLGPVDERRAAAPAVRVRVRVVDDRSSRPGRRELVDDRGVGVLHELPVHGVLPRACRRTSPRARPG